MKKTVQIHRMLWGNGYIEIQRNGAGRALPVAAESGTDAAASPREDAGADYDLGRDRDHRRGRDRWFM